ncbi:MAG: hypothetical protein WC534_01105 [Candidatus Paceibacterota bacterium]
MIEIYYEDLNPYFVPFYGAGMVVGLAIFGGLGYFVYGGLGGAFAIILVMFFYGLTGLLGFIPYIGFLVQAVASYFFVWPWVSGFTHISGTWLTTLILVLCIIGGMVNTYLTTPKHWG